MLCLAATVIARVCFIAATLLFDSKPYLSLDLSKYRPLQGHEKQHLVLEICGAGTKESFRLMAPITISAYSMIATPQLATDGPFFFDFSTTVQ